MSGFPARRVAVVIPTFNEEENIEAALDSVRGWSDEVFVVDSYSTDATVDRALARAGDGVRVVQHRFENYSAQWNWALTHLPFTRDWTLKLDADERVTPDFRDEVDEVLANAAPGLEGLYFRRRFYFMGRPLDWGGMRDNHDLRLWKTGCARFEDRAVNEHALVEGETARLVAYVEHHDFKSLSDWIAKHNRYSSLEARAIAGGNVTGEVEPRLFGAPDERRIWLRRRFYRTPGAPWVYFAYRAFARGGVLDGWPGIQYAFLHASYLNWIELKLRQQRLTGKAPPVDWPTRGDPHPSVVDSPLQRQVEGG